MEISLLSQTAVKIKTKLATFAVAPLVLKTNITTDGVLLFSPADGGKNLSVEGESVVISGPGEYEIKSIKITGIGKTTVAAFTGKFEGIDFCISQTALVKQAKDMTTECSLLILEANVVVDGALFAGFSPQVIVLYGEKAVEQAKLLGKEVTPVNKYVVTKDKLPTEMEVVVLS